MNRKNSGPDLGLKALAVEVLREYKIIPLDIRLVQGGDIKTVWKIVGEEQTVCLKRLKHAYDKALFAVHAQLHIKEKGGNVPGVLLNKNGRPLTEIREQLFAVYEWVEGTDLDFSKREDLAAAIGGLARFHSASRNYQPPAGARISTKIGRWPEQYESMKKRMTSWKELCLDKQSLSYAAVYLQSIDSILASCDQALNLLDRYGYAGLCNTPLKAHVLCHQDYGRGNAILTPAGVFVLDLDNVTYDFAARDLRKIIGKQAEKKGIWELKSIVEIINWYAEAAPLPVQERNLLYIDLLFPHLFFGLVKNAFQNNKPLKAAEIERMARLEQSKLPVLQELLMKGEYPTASRAGR